MASIAEQRERADALNRAKAPTPAPRADPRRKLYAAAQDGIELNYEQEMQAQAYADQYNLPWPPLPMAEGEARADWGNR